MLFGIYLGTTAFVLFDTIRHQLYLDKRLKKEGYKFTANKYSGFADVVIGVFYLIALSLPGFNLFFPFSHINKDKSYDEYKNYLLDAGSIERESSNNLLNKIKESDSSNTNKNVIKIDKANLCERVNRYGHIYYSSTNNDEISEIEENAHVYKKVLK